MTTTPLDFLPSLLFAVLTTIVLVYRYRQTPRAVGAHRAKGRHSFYLHAGRHGTRDSLFGIDNIKLAIWRQRANPLFVNSSKED